MKLFKVNCYKKKALPLPIRKDLGISTSGNIKSHQTQQNKLYSVPNLQMKVILLKVLYWFCLA